MVETRKVLKCVHVFVCVLPLQTSLKETTLAYPAVCSSVDLNSTVFNALHIQNLKPMKSKADTDEVRRRKGEKKVKDKKKERQEDKPSFFFLSAAGRKDGPEHNSAH